MRVPADGCVLQCIVYTSRLVGEWTSSSLTEMVNAAGQRNSALLISGRLMMVDGLFIQVLEGPAAAVTPLYARIRRDRRHSDIRTVLDTRVSRRAFSGWAMDLVTESMMSRAQVTRAAGLAATGDGRMILAGMAASRLAGPEGASPWGPC